MATNFPTSLDSFTNPASTDLMNSVTVPHNEQHANVNDAVEALQAKVGVDSSAVTTSLDYKVAQLEAGATGGKILQVVSTAKTDTFSASVASGATSNVTGLSVTITPSSTSSTIYLCGMVYGSSETLYYLSADITRNGTNIINADSPGNRTPALVGPRQDQDATDGGPFGMSPVSVAIIDSPASTSALTYQVRVANTSGATRTMYVNRTTSDSNIDDAGRAISTLIAMEVSA